MHNIVVVRKTVYKVKCDQNTYANREKSSDIHNYVCLVFMISKTIPNSQPIYQCCIAAFPLGNFPPPKNLLHVSSAPFTPKGNYYRVVAPNSRVFFNVFGSDYIKIFMETH